MGRLHPQERAGCSTPKRPWRISSARERVPPPPVITLGKFRLGTHGRTAGRQRWCELKSRMAGSGCKQQTRQPAGAKVIVYSIAAQLRDLRSPLSSLNSSWDVPTFSNACSRSRCFHTRGQEQVPPARLRYGPRCVSQISGKWNARRNALCVRPINERSAQKPYFFLVNSSPTQ